MTPFVLGQEGGSNDGAQGANDKKKEEMEELVSLGTIAFDPVWIFYRAESAKKRRGRFPEYWRVRELPISY